MEDDTPPASIGEASLSEFLEVAVESWMHFTTLFTSRIFNPIFNSHRLMNLHLRFVSTDMKTADECQLRKQWHELGMICANQLHKCFSVVVSVSNNPSHQCLGSTGEWMPWVDASDPYQVIKVGWWNADWWIFGKFWWPWCLVVAQWHHV
jgi:hypothetical protein